MKELLQNSYGKLHRVLPTCTIWLQQNIKFDGSKECLEQERKIMSD
jgi:hypothetical protein